MTIVVGSPGGRRRPARNAHGIWSMSMGGAAAALSVSVAFAATNGFDALMDQAMQRMHHDMMQPATGNPDRDFATIMIPHHQGAVDMAKVELQFGKDPRLRRLAQGIIVEQAQEIAVMRQVLADTENSRAPMRHQGPGQ